MKFCTFLIIVSAVFNSAFGQVDRINPPPETRTWTKVNHNYGDDEMNEQKDADDSFLATLQSRGIHFRGRIYSTRGVKFRIFENDKGQLLKPYPTNKEINFYETVQKSENTLMTELKKHYIPRYFGTEDIKNGNEVVEFLRFENVANEFQLPASVEVKIGLVRNRAEEQKLESMEQMKQLGFRILEHVSYNYNGKPRNRGQELKGLSNIDEMIVDDENQLFSQSIVFYNFIHGEIGLKCGVLDRILKQLLQLEAWHKRQKFFRFYDSSILLNYDAESLVEASRYRGSTTFQESCEDIAVPQPKIRMIHFDETVPIEDGMNTEDDKYLFGLGEFISMIRELNSSYQYFQD